jgi:hypothetical protein
LVLALLLVGLAIAYALTDGFGTNTPSPNTTTTVTSTETKTATQSPTTSTSSSTSTSSTTTTTTQGSAEEDAKLERFIQDYYRDVTKENRRDDTFDQLTPAMQDKSDGREGYETFWSQIESVKVDSIEASSADAEATVELTFKDQAGKESKETHLLTFVKDGDSWLIDSDTRT